MSRTPSSSPPEASKNGNPSSPYPDFGPGSVAGFGARLLAFLLDAVLADLLALAFNGGFHNSGAQNLASYLFFLLIEFVFVTLASQTPGMRIVGIAVVRADGQGRPAPQWVLLRTALLAAVAPALVIDGTGRAMHDRAAGTVMLHTR